MNDQLALGAADPETDDTAGDLALPEERRPAEEGVALAPPQKAAIVLAAAGPEVASALLRDMGEEAMRTFARTISHMDRIPPETVEAVIEEFLAALGRGESVVGGPTVARRILGAALDDTALDQVMDDISEVRTFPVWERLGQVSVAALARFVGREHPQVGTVILTRIRSDIAARVLERLTPELGETIVLRMTRAPQLDADVLRQVEAVIEEEFLSVVQRAKSTRKPADLLADLMNQMSGVRRDAFLQQLEEEQPTFAAEVQRIMFTFGDIPMRVSPRDVARILRAVEEPVLMAALKSAQATAPQAVEYIVGNISKRLAERMQEDLGQMLEVPLKEGEAAQAEVIKAIQALAQTGEFALIEPEAPEDD
ncbi:MAG: FliG C-terminal domain-containing protein [Pseudomonadota bacterium]